MSDDAAAPGEGAQFPSGAVVREIPIVNKRGLRHAAAIARRLPAEAKTVAAEKVDAAAETEPSLAPARPTAHGYQLAPVTSPLVGEVGSGATAREPGGGKTSRGLK